MAIKIYLDKLLTHQNFFKGFLREKHQNIRILVLKFRKKLFGVGHPPLPTPPSCTSVSALE